ncbi:MAG: deoxyguanosinetriphosphate triphosphohydrolase [Planctomycetota bacterium]
MERRGCAAYAVLSAHSRGRRQPEPEDPFRTAFRRDRDRIVHASAFRRLEYKTQVFVYKEGDYYRTRLTHTLEVAQIARSIAVALGLNESLVEAIALAHDLGHPPFGHSGEDGLRARMHAHGGFEHNAQALRVVDYLERRYPGFRGLNLTHEVRESLLKKGSLAAGGVGTDLSPGPVPYLAAQVVDQADSIAYNHHDLDDGLRSRIFSMDDLDTLDLWRRACELAPAGYRDLPEKIRHLQVINQLVKMSIHDLIEESSRRIREHDPKSAEQARQVGGKMIDFSPAMRAEQEDLKRFLFHRFYRADRVRRMREKAITFVQALFDAYLAEPSRLPSDFQETSSQQGIERAVADYVAGMTDRYAEQEYLALYSPFETV